MWSPRDKTSVPTPQERTYARNAIEKREQELVAAFEALAQAQRHVEYLKNDLVERRAWLAPIRLLNYDTLALIFLEVVRDDWRMALELASVSSLWREYMLSTPAVWASFGDKGGLSVRRINLQLYIDRSKGRPLCIQSVLPSPRITDLIVNNYERIQCLRSDDIYSRRKHHTWPHLKHLACGGDLMELLRQMTQGQLPALQSLTINNSYYSTLQNGDNQITQQKKNLPPISSLYISLDYAQGLGLLFQLWAQSLVHLEVKILLAWVNVTDNDIEITLPALKSLVWLCQLDDLEDTPNVSNTYTLQAPKLEALDLDNTSAHGYVFCTVVAPNLRSLRVDKVDLDELAKRLGLSSLLHLQIYTSPHELPDIIDRLISVPDFLRNLRQLEIRFSKQAILPSSQLEEHLDMSIHSLTQAHRPQLKCSIMQDWSTDPSHEWEKKCDLCRR